MPSGRAWRCSARRPIHRKKGPLTEDAGGLWQAVDNLGAKNRLPVILFYVHGLTAPQIAEVLDIRVGDGVLTLALRLQ